MYPNDVQNLQIVYVLTNPAMPGLVKIGKTTRKEVAERMRELFGTGVPFPFDCAFACRVADATMVEQALHVAFGNVRVNANREFFNIEPERVIAILKLLDVKDSDTLTEELEQEIDNSSSAIDKQANEHYKEARRPRMDFVILGIAAHSVLVYKENPDITATVLNNRKVFFQGEEMSLTEATRRVMGLPDGYQIQPSPYWLYNGESIKKIYDEYHEAEF